MCATALRVESRAIIAGQNTQGSSVRLVDEETTKMLEEDRRGAGRKSGRSGGGDRCELFVHGDARTCQKGTARTKNEGRGESRPALGRIKS